MKVVANTLCRIALSIALATGVLLDTAIAQDTVEVSANAAARNLLQRAEAMLGNGDSQGAYALLRPREAEFSGNAYFDYLLGVAALDSGRANEAILSLNRSAAAAPDFSGARMELARAYFDAGEPDSARPLFVALLGENPPAVVRDVLDRYLAAIDARPTAPPSRFSPYTELLLGHDSNANGSTDDQQFLGFTLNPENLETDSSFIEGGAGFGWFVPKNAGFAWQLAARAGYRKNPDASFVDAGILSGTAGMNWRSGAVFGQASFDVYWTTRDSKSNESYGGIDFLIGRQLNEKWDLRFSVRGGALRFADSIEILDVDRILYTAGASYRFGSRARFNIELIGGSDSEKQGGSPYGNSKSGGRLGLSAPIGRSSFLHASIGRLGSDYDGQFFGATRDDTQTTSTLQLEFRDVLTPGLTIAPRIRYIDNESDVALYDYDRTEVGLLIRWMP